MAEIRLNKFLAERTGLSRREADDAIVAGRVTVDGERASLGTRISLDKKPKVCYNGDLIPLELKYTYLAMNKPVNVVCSRHAQGGEKTIYEFLPAKYRNLKTVGRLDKDSEGLILLTNDGDFAYQMTHPRFSKEKKYVVWLDKPLQPLHQQEIADFGVQLEDGRSQLGLLRLDDAAKNFEVTMHEGRNRQIRRTFKALGYTVVRLKRIQFGKYQLAGLKNGEFVEVRKIF